MTSLPDNFRPSLLKQFWHRANGSPPVGRSPSESSCAIDRYVAEGDIPLEIQSTVPLSLSLFAPDENSDDVRGDFSRGEIQRERERHVRSWN